MPYAPQQTRKNRRAVITLSACFYSKENRRNPVLLLAFLGMYVLFKRSHGGLTQVFPRKPKPCIKLPFPPIRTCRYLVHKMDYPTRTEAIPI